MLSSVVTSSTMERSSQDTGASTILSPLQDVDPGPAPSCGLLYWRPLLAMAAGALMFGSGTVVSLLYFTRVGHVPYLLGPLFLSVGLMLLVTGLVWVPVLKQSLEHKKLSKANQSEVNLVELRHR